MAFSSEIWQAIKFQKSFKTMKIRLNKSGGVKMRIIARPRGRRKQKKRRN